MGKRIVRAKRKIADAHIPYAVPADEDILARLGAVLTVVYLIFNEGHSATAGDSLVRRERCARRSGSLRRARDPGAADAYRRAIELTDNVVEREELQRRLREVGA